MNCVMIFMMNRAGQIAGRRLHDERANISFTRAIERLICRLDFRLAGDAEHARDVGPYVRVHQSTGGHQRHAAGEVRGYGRFPHAALPSISPALPSPASRPVSAAPEERRRTAAAGVASTAIR